MKTLRDCRDSLDRVIHWCNDNDDLETAENIELYLHALQRLAVRATEHILDLDYDYVKDNYNSWSEYLMENFGADYDDFKLLTNAELADIFNQEQT